MPDGLFAPGPGRGVTQEIVADNGSALSEGPAGRTQALGLRVDPHRDVVDVVLCAAGACQRRQNRGAGLGPAGPGHRETAMPDKRVAGALHKLPAGVGAGNRVVDARQRKVQATQTLDLQLGGLQLQEAAPHGVELAPQHAEQQQRRDCDEGDALDEAQMQQRIGVARQQAEYPVRDEDPETSEQRVDHADPNGAHAQPEGILGRWLVDRRIDGLGWG